MPSWSGIATEPPQSVYQKATGVISGQDMKLVSTIPNQSLTAEGSRDFNVLIMGILVIAGFILIFAFGTGLILLLAALVYFLVSKKNVFNVGITPAAGGSQVTIMASGSKAEAAMNQMVGVIQLSLSGALRNCRNCGAAIVDPSALFCPSCGSRQ